MSDGEATRERIVLGLRLSRGIPAAEVESWIGQQGDPRLPGDYADWRAGGVLTQEEGRLRFTEHGFLVSNEVLCRFV